MAAVPVVARDAERDAIRRWLDAPRPCLLRLEGVAGIGKSTLWTDAIQRASTAGETTLTWRASFAERDVAFATLSALLDRPVVADQLPTLAHPRRTALEVALGLAPPTHRAGEPRLIGLAVSDVLRGLSAAGPVLIGLDDLQWIDRASEDALAFAARRLVDSPVAFLVAARSEASVPAPPGANLATSMQRQQTISVGSMSVAALGKVIQDRLDAALPRPLLVRIHSATAGNPFQALEIARSLLTRQALPGPAEPFPVPVESVPLVRERLATLTRDAYRGVVAVAMSPEPRREMIERAIGRRGGRAVEEACRKGILAAHGDRLRSVHPLFTGVAYSDTPPSDRQALRRLLAHVVDDPVERAAHLAHTVNDRDDSVADALATGGRLALARGAPALAAHLLERAADQARGSDRRSRLLVETAAAEMVSGDPEKSVVHLNAALALEPDGPTRVAALLALGEILYVEQPAEALPVLVSALEHTGGDPILTATVHSYVTAMADMDPPQGNLSADLAAELLTRPGVEPEAEHLACALLDRAFHRLLRGEPASIEDINAGLALRSGSGNSFVARRAQEVAERCLFHLGRLAEARALDEAEYRRLLDSGEFGLLPPMAQTLSVLTQLAGDWVAARRYADECVEAVAQGMQAWRERSLLAVGRIKAWDGDLVAARSIAMPALAAQESAGDRWEATIYCALLGFVELSEPDPAAAVSYLTRAMEHSDAMEIRLPTQFRFLGDLVEAAALAGDLGLAERILVERLERVAVAQPLPWTIAMARRGRGLLAIANGDAVTAIGLLDQAIAVFDTALPMPFERGRTLFARGQAHRRAGHRTAARADLGAAAATFAELGARAWLGRTTAELGRIGGRTAAGTELTAAERKVVELAVAGRSNREIAAELMVSIRTVESQLSAVYRKFSVRSRGQLAAIVNATAGPPATG